MKETYTYKYFEGLANIDPQNEYETYQKKLGQEVLENLKSVNDYSGYAVLKDGTIRCTDQCGFYVGAYDGCTEREMNSGINAMIMGYQQKYTMYVLYNGHVIPLDEYLEELKAFGREAQQRP